MIDQKTADDIRTRHKHHNDARKNLFPGQYSFTPEQLATLPPNPSNDELGLLEDYEWRTMPPDRYFLYVEENDNKKPVKVTNWTGITLGTITSFENVLTCYTPSGGQYQKQAIRFKGTNGCDYHGWYYCSNGTYARVKMSAHSKRTKIAA